MKRIALGMLFFLTPVYAGGDKEQSVYDPVDYVLIDQKSIDGHQSPDDGSSSEGASPVSVAAVVKRHPLRRSKTSYNLLLDPKNQDATIPEDKQSVATPRRRKKPLPVLKVDIPVYREAQQHIEQK